MAIAPDTTSKTYTSPFEFGAPFGISTPRNPDLQPYELIGFLLALAPAPAPDNSTPSHPLPYDYKPKPKNRHVKKGTKSKMCRDFAFNGKCSYGEGCKFEHLPLGAKDNKSRTCRSFAFNGKCSYGEGCKFEH